MKFHYNYRYPEPIAEAQPEQTEPPPEWDFWDDWIRKKQPVSEPPPPPPPPPRETPKTPKTQKKQEKIREKVKEGTHGRVLSPLSHIKT